MSKWLKILFTFWAFLGTSLPSLAQLQFETRAPFALLMDYQSGTVLFQKQADARMEPASMAKMMTIALTFRMLKNGSLSMDDEFFISEYAWREGGASSGGSTMFAELNSKVSVGDLLKSVIIQSGNDASIALAEGIGGTEETFALMMNEMAFEIGLKSSNFTNSTGLPDENMYVTARDLANLARYIIREFPQYYPIFSEPSFEWNKIKQSNRNTLLKMGIGVDGLKTGFTESSGYGEVVSSAQGGRRIIAVLHGMETMKQRSEEARKLVSWGTRSFENLLAFDNGEIVNKVPIYGGEISHVGLVGEGAINLYLPKGSRKCLSAKIIYSSPILPPVEAGDEIAKLQISCNKQIIQTTPLFAEQSVARGSLLRQATDALKELALGWM
ncbi:MAG: D-alanyl-D-alanine carboxypeptidase [Devosiaceae bacterium]|nr:D-alanyl-D-alanine carboxypeptidase [Devosiaceae bacterium]